MGPLSYAPNYRESSVSIVISRTSFTTWWKRMSFTPNKVVVENKMLAHSLTAYNCYGKVTLETSSPLKWLSVHLSKSVGMPCKTSNTKISHINSIFHFLVIMLHIRFSNDSANQIKISWYLVSKLFDLNCQI